MRQRFLFAALFVAVFCTAQTLAQCSKTCPHAKTCTKNAEPAADGEKTDGCTHQHGDADHEQASKDGKSAMCDSAVTCDGDRVRFEEVKIPRIGFKVDETVTCCMKSATELAGGDTSKIKFDIDGKTYDKLEDAKVARLAVLEKFYQDMLTMKYTVGKECVGCPMAAQHLAKKDGKPLFYRVGGYDFAEKAEAEKAIDAGRAAGEKIAMTWAVGDEKFDCPAHAAEAAKSSDKPLEYCIGDERTPCETTGKTRLIEARITAALESIAEAAKS